MRFVNYKILLGITIILILVLVLKNVGGKSLQIYESESILENLKKELYEKQNHNKFLNERLKYVQTNKFIEDESREKLGLVRKGEVVVQEKLENTNNLTVEQKLSPPNWKQWLELFL